MSEIFNSDRRLEYDWGFGLMLCHELNLKSHMESEKTNLIHYRVTFTSFLREDVTW
jgi:hypothetical protein